MDRILELWCAYTLTRKTVLGKVQQVRVTYNGSQQQYAPVQLQGMFTCGVIDSEADITIMGRELFRQVAAEAKLRRNQLMSHTHMTGLPSHWMAIWI